MMSLFTLTHPLLIRVEPRRVDALVLDDVYEGLAQVATPAAVVAIGDAAVHKVLLAKRSQLACSVLHLGLQSTRRTECPAGTTCSLQMTPTK